MVEVPGHSHVSLETRSCIGVGIVLSSTATHARLAMLSDSVTSTSGHLHVLNLQKWNSTICTCSPLAACGVPNVDIGQESQETDLFLSAEAQWVLAKV